MRMRTIDWNRKRSYSYRNYIQTQVVHGVEEIHFVYPKRGCVENIRFQNFPQLHIAQNQVVQCVFEDCGELYLTSNYGHSGCIFNNIKVLYCSGKFLTHCEFENIQCDRNAFVELIACYMGGCTFKNVQLQNEARLVLGHGFSYIYGQKLENITAERKDGKLFYRDTQYHTPFVRQ